jgi:predicted GNAT family N-acyltransferase
MDLAKNNSVTGPNARTCATAAHASRRCAEMVELRHAVLRAPLGLVFSDEELLAEADSVHIGCWQGEQLVGCLVLKPAADDIVHMRQVAVRPAHQRKGIGRELVAYSERHARELGFRTMALHARESAVPFYCRLDYIADGPRFLEVGIPHFQMRKTLT